MLTFGGDQTNACGHPGPAGDGIKAGLAGIKVVEVHVYFADMPILR